jgi:hypothetical protein
MVLNYTIKIGIFERLGHRRCQFNNGFATWQNPGSLAWNHEAAKNINMNGFALTNQSTASPATNTDAGLRLDNTGNVRIGTLAPTATDGKLQVDGTIKATNGRFTTDQDGLILPDSRLTVGGFPAINKTYSFANTLEAYNKSLVLNVGTLRENALTNSTNGRRSLTFYDVPPSNLEAQARTLFSIQDRNDVARLAYHTNTGGASLFGINDKNGQKVIELYDDSQNAFFVLPKAGSYFTIGGTQQWPIAYKFEVKNGASKFGGNVFVNNVIGIGTETSSFQETTGTVNYSLAVKGNVRAYMYKAITDGWSDFVFKKDYKLPNLKTVEKHIAATGHLPNIPSEKEIVKDGIDLGEIAKLQMQKIEELTLYLIEQNKKIERMAKEIKALKKHKK